MAQPTGTRPFSPFEWMVSLRYLRSRGLFQVMLYVDESNTAAIRLYEALGFTHWDTDVMFARHDI